MFKLPGKPIVGTAIAGDLLLNKTATVPAGLLTGSMPNNGVFDLVSGATVPKGYYSGGSVPAETPVVGTAIASNLLLGKTATVPTGLITGTMPNKVGSATVITPSGADQAIPQGYYGGAVGDGKVAPQPGITPVLTPALHTLTAATERPATTTAYLKYKEIIVQAAGTVAVSFNIKTVNVTYTAYGRIYINGAGVGIEHTSVSTNYAEYTENFAVNKGDLIQLYMHNSDTPQTGMGCNFSVAYSISNTLTTVTLD
jgi:hypothetical protein